ncbi:MAG: hypothetical protein H7841_03815 [Magnetospirillum sp. WYHS-4]
MALPPNVQSHLPSQENLLLDYLRRLEKQKDGRKAVLILISGLKPFNRREQHVRAATSSFEPLAQEMEGQLFSLKTADLIFIYKESAHPRVETVVQKIRFLFSDDPLLEDDSSERRFVTWYDVATQFEDILRLVQSLVDVEDKKLGDMRDRRSDTRASLKARQERGEPLTPAVLARVEQSLGSADLSNLVRRQFVCAFDAKLRPQPFFSELFISIADLRETVVPGVNMTANRWLFQHLTETLDRRMLSMLGKTDRIAITGDISFNLNIATLLSNEFLAFDDNITAGRRGAMIIELQLVDIFADLNAFMFVREFVQDKGYRICVDSLNHQTMELVDRDKLGVDLVKIVWSPELVDRGEEMHDRVRAFVKRIGENRVIMCRVDSREAIDFGRRVGIALFQGRQVENLIAEDNRRKELLKLKRRIERSAPAGHPPLKSKS